MKMTSRERVLRAAEHKETDRIPFYFRADGNVAEKLKKAWGAKTHEQLLKITGSDAIRTKLAFKNDINAVFNGALSGAETVNEVYNFKWPSADTADYESSLKAVMAARETGLAVYGGAWATLLSVARLLLGEENFLIGLIENPGLIHAVVDRTTDFFLEVNGRFLEKAAKYIDFFYYGIDFGTQRSLYISREHINTFFIKNIKRLNDQAKSYGLKVMFHSCGAIYEIINDLKASGVDMLDPVQTGAAKMDSKSLADGFKKTIAFHGGINTQNILPFGSPQKVREEVALLIKHLGPQGLVAAPDQDIIGEVPIENIVAMLEAVRGVS